MVPGSLRVRVRCSLRARTLFGVPHVRLLDSPRERIQGSFDLGACQNVHRAHNQDPVRTRGDKTIVFGTTATDLNGEAGPLRFYWHPPGTLFLIEVDPLFFAPVADLSFEGEINWQYHGVKEWQGY